MSVLSAQGSLRIASASRWLDAWAAIAKANVAARVRILDIRFIRALL